MLSTALQQDNLDIVLAFESILESGISLRKLLRKNPLDWTTVKTVLEEIEKNDGSYQGAQLKLLGPETKAQVKEQVVADVGRLSDCMQDRLKWSDTRMLRSVLAFLDSKGWQKIGDARNPAIHKSSSSSSDDEQQDEVVREVLSAVDYIVERFRAPLQAKGADIFSLREETQSILQYARQHLPIVSEPYRKIWYYLHASPNAGQWKNALLLCELVFSLPFSNAKVERIFSTLKTVKSNRRTNLSISALHDLLEINIEGPPLEDFSPLPAVQLWWSSCNTRRRTNQQTRKQYKPRRTAASSPSSDESVADMAEPACALHDWDAWLDSDADSTASDSCQSD